MNNLESIHSTNVKGGRIQYDTEWNVAQPFVCYLNGSASKCFPTLRDAAVYMRGCGFIFDTSALK